MRLKDLLNEMEEAASAESGAVPEAPPTPQQTTISRNNFVRITMIQDELTRIFGNGNEPYTDFDDSGMFIVLNNAQKMDYDYAQDKGVVFTLPEQPFMVNEKTQYKSFRIMFLKVEEPDETAVAPEGETGEETPPPDAV